MSRYSALTDHLAARVGRSWQAKFDEIESILGFGLPPSAYRYPAWWANQRTKGHSQVLGWRGAGWKTTRLNLAERMVTFERDVLSASQAKVAGAASQFFDSQEAVEFLIGLGGTMPDLVVAPRERPVF